MIEKWTRSELVYKGKIISVRAGEIALENGAMATREVVEHPGGVAVVPVLDDCVLLCRQYRIAMGEDVLEIPAGKLEGPEDPETRGRHELAEELGYRAGRLVPAGRIYASVGYTSEIISLFLAFELEHVGQNQEFDEDIELVRIPISEARRMVAENAIKDAKTIVGLEALFRHLDKHSSSE